MIKFIDEEDKIFLIVLDEIDKSFKKNGDDIFYFLTDINSMLKNSRVAIIGITNNSRFTQECLSTQTKSRLGEEKIVFPPYTPQQLIDILNDRAREAFYPNALDSSVVNYCAAVSAQDSGDARKALDLLRIAADIAERNGDTCVTSAHVDYARQKIELDAVSEVIRTLTDQSKIILKSIIISPKNDEGYLTTGEVYATYMNIANQLACPVISQRRVADLISELDMLGIINARVKSFGRKGRTKEIEINVSNDILSILDRDELFDGLVIKSGKQMTFDSHFE